jgi:superfamily II DNA/RNA helicase
MSLPTKADDYLHRAGRTGRLGTIGKVITLAQSQERFAIERFANELQISFKLRELQLKSGSLLNTDETSNATQGKIMTNTGRKRSSQLSSILLNMARKSKTE